MTPDEDRIARLYEAFNARDFDRWFTMMTPDVSWPDELENGRLEGLEAVRNYVLRLTAPVRGHYEPISLFTSAPHQVEVLSRQIITSAADGTVWSSTRARHRYTLRNGLVSRMESEQNYAEPSFPGIEQMLCRLVDAINARDVDAAVACYAPDARFTDMLEGGEIVGADAIRAYHKRLFETVGLTLSLLDYRLESDDRVRTRMLAETRSPHGGLWQDGPVVIWYRLYAGRITEQDVDDSGESAP